MSNTQTITKAERNNELVERYRKFQEEMSEDAKAEERFELEAAFGRGETVVNVLTGERIRL